MHQTSASAPARSSRTGDPALAARLRKAIRGEVLFDPYSRGRYSTDASIYQVEPIGVVVPRSVEDVAAALAIAREQGISVLPRGGGTSQCGQTVSQSLVVDTSKYLREILELDRESLRVTVQPGLVLDQLNAALKPHDLFFPIDPSTANRATIGGMVGNNSCGARSIRYGNTVHNVLAIEAFTAAGEHWQFGPTPADLDALDGAPGYRELVRRLREIAAREAGEIETRWPKLLRHVGGYNINTIAPDGHNMAKMLVGSEGTLAFFSRIDLQLQPLPAHRVLGVCHFPTFYQAMDVTRHIVGLDPSAVEVVDRTLMDLARDIPAFRPTLDRYVRGAPDALLLVEFAGAEQAPLLEGLRRLQELLADLGFARAVVELVEPAQQRELWEVRKAGLNIMMSMKGDGKPVSFIEDCAVPLEDLAEYTRRLSEVFARHGTRGTWYAHASVGCLHVRPILNMKDPAEVKKMRAIAEEAFAMVREYKGSHSGEHGDGIVRSEFHEPMLGARIVRALEEIKDAFDPQGLFNPNRIVHPPKMDDRRLFRYMPGYAATPTDAALDWRQWGGFAGAIEMCNNNGACRKASPGAMCPSYRATGDEQHVTRGRANSLRLAITGQLGPDALASPELRDTLSLCLSCKACKRECPTGVDMARMKIEALHHYHRRHGLRLRDRLVAWLPRYAPRVAPAAALLNGALGLPGSAWLGERLLGFSARRPLPRWSRSPFTRHDCAPRELGEDGRDLVLFADTFNTWYEPENLRAAVRVLEASGRRVHLALPADGGRPLCCGRTFLSCGQVEEAAREQRRLLDALAPYVSRGVPILGLEPSCLLTLRDELSALIPGAEAAAVAEQALLVEEWLARAAAREGLNLALRPVAERRALLHTHCHQKAMGAAAATATMLELVPRLQVQAMDSTCCGMAGAFGYEREHYEVSLRIGDLGVLPAIRECAPETLILAGGTSCRQQIRHATGREAQHPIQVLARALV